MRGKSSKRRKNITSLRQSARPKTAVIEDRSKLIGRDNGANRTTFTAQTPWPHYIKLEQTTPKLINSQEASSVTPNVFKLGQGRNSSENRVMKSPKHKPTTLVMDATLASKNGSTNTTNTGNHRHHCAYNKRAYS